MNSTKIQWRVEARESRTKKWIRKGLFETRANARLQCEVFREWVGFGNTRVVKYVKGQKP